jgi:hypothetical protein
MFDRVKSHLTDLCPGLPQLLLDMKVAHRDDQVDRVCTKVCGVVDIQVESPDIGAYLGLQPGICDQPDCLPFSLGCSGGTCLDNVYADIREGGCDFKFLYWV